MAKDHSASSHPWDQPPKGSYLGRMKERDARERIPRPARDAQKEHPRPEGQAQTTASTEKDLMQALTEAGVPTPCEMPSRKSEMSNAALEKGLCALAKERRVIQAHNATKINEVARVIFHEAEVSSTLTEVEKRQSEGRWTGFFPDLCLLRPVEILREEGETSKGTSKPTSAPQERLNKESQGSKRMEDTGRGGMSMMARLITGYVAPKKPPPSAQPPPQPAPLTLKKKVKKAHRLNSLREQEKCLNWIAQPSNLRESQTLSSSSLAPGTFISWGQILSPVPDIFTFGGPPNTFRLLKDSNFVDAFRHPYLPYPSMLDEPVAHAILNCRRVLEEAEKTHFTRTVACITFYSNSTGTLKDVSFNRLYIAAGQSVAQLTDYISTPRHEKCQLDRQVSLWHLPLLLWLTQIRVMKSEGIDTTNLRTRVVTEEEIEASQRERDLTVRVATVRTHKKGRLFGSLHKLFP